MLYEYEHCGEKFERLLPIDKRDSVECPKCGELAKRLFASGTRHVWVGPPDYANAWKHGQFV
jgi:putative FmdB family regulatory protein